MFHMATTESAIREGQRVRRMIGQLKRKLSECREAMDNILDENCPEIDILNAKEVELIHSIEVSQVELAQLMEQIETLSKANVRKSVSLKNEKAKSEEELYHSLQFGKSPDRFDMSPGGPAQCPVLDDETYVVQEELRGDGFVAPPAAVAPVHVHPLPAVSNPKKLPELPSLFDFSLLQAHYNRCEAILTECGLGSYRNTPTFSITQQTYSVIYRFVGSLKIPSMAKYAEDLANYHDNWNQIKCKLLARFASPAAMHEEYTRRLSNLQLKGDVSLLIDNAREAWRLGRVICKNPLLEQKELIRRICQLLPVDILRETYISLNVINNPDWECETVMDGENTESFFGAVCAAGKLADIVNRAKPRFVKEPLDSTKKISDSALNAPNGSKRLEFKDFYKAVTVVFNLNTEPVVLKEVESILPSERTRSYLSKKSRGFLVGLNSEEEVELVKSRLTNFKCIVRDFLDKGYQKSPPGTPQIVPRDSVARAAVLFPSLISEYFVCGDVTVHDNPTFGFSFPLLLQVDSGAGLDYLCLSQVTRNALRASGAIRDIEPFGVSQANGSVETVREYVDTVIRLYPADSRYCPIGVNSIRLFLLGISDGSEMSVLLGRNAIARFDLVISKHGVCDSAGIPLMETALTERYKLFDSVKMSEISPDFSDLVLKQLVSQDWCPLQRSPSYEIRLRNVTRYDKKDHPDQTHLFEVKVPKPSEKVDQSEIYVRELESRVRESYRKMSPTKQSIHRELTVNYENLGWWKRATVDECRKHSSFTPAPCFLIGGGVISTKKPRIVVDFRPLNETIPDSSTPGLTPAHCLASLRMTHPEAVVIADASSAFYKIRIFEDALWLITAVDGKHGIEVVHILCSRVVFGVQFGPSSLISSMTLLFTRDGRSRFDGFSGWYVDDDLIGGSIEEVVATLQGSVRLLRRVGHELQFSKCSAICTEQKKFKFASLLADISPLTVSESAIVFGTVIRFDNNSLNITCDHLKRQNALKTMANANEFTKLSKSDYFGIAGCLAYDVLKAHAETKLLSDCIKSLIGREYSDVDWKSGLDLKKLSCRKREAFQIMTEWASDQLKAHTCSHSTFIQQARVRNPEICLYTDSSTIGGGFTICSPTSQGVDELWTDAWRWSGTQLKWHCNLLEFNAIERALKPLVDILAFHYQCTPETTPRPNVKVFSDNRSAVKWTSLTSGDLLSKHQSRHSIMRMVDSISAEWQRVRQFADTSIEHVSGLKNSRADALSRFMFRTVKSGVPSGNISELLECEKKVKIPKIKEGPLLKLIEAMEEEDSDLDPPQLCDDAANDDQDLAYSSCDPEFKWWLEAPRNDEPQKILEDNFAKNLDFEDSNAVEVIQNVDRVCYLKDEETVVNETLIERLAGTCNNLEQLYFRLRLARTMFQTWRGRKNGDDGNDSKIPDSHLLGKCAQVDYDESKLPVALRTEVGPCLSFDGLRLVRVPLPTGEYLALPLIPFECKNVQSIIVREAHRLVNHMGPDYTCAKIYDDFYLVKVKMRVNEIVSKCLTCQMKNAVRQFKDGFTMGHNRVNLLPYQSMAIDHLALDHGLYCLSVVCLNSGHSSWSLCDRTADDTATALKRILYRYSVQPKYILSDKAVNLSATIRLIEKEFGPVEFHQTTSYSQFENGVCERLHKIGCDILRTKLHLSNLTLDPSWSSIEIQDLLDMACCALNLRPVGWYVETSNEVKYPITPHVLVFGNCGLLVHQRNPTLDKWKQVYFNYYWQIMKKRSELNVRGKRHVFRIGEPVLVFNGSAGKLEFSWKLAHVKDITSEKNRVRLVDGAGKLFLQNVYNVCPLKVFHKPLPFDVSRVSALVEYEVESVAYVGQVIEDDGKVLVRWNPVGNMTWADEWLDWPDLALVELTN